MSDAFPLFVKKDRIRLSNVSILVEMLEAHRLIPVLAPWIAWEMGYDAVFVERFLLRIEAEDLVQHHDLDAWLEADSPWEKTALGRWLRAHLLTMRGHLKQGTNAWRSVIQTGQGNQAEAYLNRARLYTQQQQYDQACHDLRSAVSLSSDYCFLSKAVALFKRLKPTNAACCNHSVKIAFLGSTTPNLTVDFLTLLGFRDGITISCYTCPFGHFKQDILDASSELYAFKPNYVFIATYWRDAGLPGYASAPETEIEAVVVEYRRLWEVLLSRQACTIIQHTFDLPAIDAYGRLSSNLTGGRNSMLREINRRWQHDCPENVLLIDVEHLSAQWGNQRWENRPQWYWARQYPAPDALLPLVNGYLALLRAVFGLNKKGIVLDLDNTLWGGVIAEDGLAGIEVGPPSPAGEAYRDFQSYLLGLKERGILLAVCSKNHWEDAVLPFEQHDSMVLSLEDILVFKANWQDKTANLRAIAQELNIATESLVFVDDNPLECQRIRQNLPEVAVVELPQEVADYIATLHAGLFFEAVNLSSEDQQRHSNYEADRQRRHLSQHSTSLDSFLKGLDMSAVVMDFSDAVLDRVTQLIGRTNQFNLTTKHYRKDELQSMMVAPDYWTRCFRLKDRYGDNGIVGAMIADTQLAHWQIILWVMSCRVFGRGLESLMIAALVQDARRAGSLGIKGCYKPSGKNSMVADLYLSLGFQRCAEGDTEEQGKSFFLDVSAFQPSEYFIRTEKTSH